MAERGPKVMLVAGEVSGDQLAAGLFGELQRIMPDVRGMGMGGAHMRAAGIDVRYDSSRIAVIGLMEVLENYRRIRAALALMDRILCEERPDLLICVDYKEFNFRLARRARRYGVKVLFYVGPQVWAWRPGRLEKYREVVDMMAVIFPFEVALYRRAGIPVRYVGHPAVDRAMPRLSRSEARQRFASGTHGPIIGLLPGSRDNELRRLLPVMLVAARQLKQHFASARFLLLQADSVEDAPLESELARAGEEVRVVKNAFHDALQCCDAAICASGTATLELALLGVPMVVTYRLSPPSYWLARLLIRTPYIALPNIVAARPIVRECVQYASTPDRLAAEIKRILDDDAYRRTMRGDLDQVRRLMGTGGGSRNMALLAADMLNDARGRSELLPP